MNKSTKKQPAERRRAMNVGRRWPLIAITIVVAIGVVSAMSVEGESSGFEALNGRWLRPDGGYIL
jgi:hypothetical protein